MFGQKAKRIQELETFVAELTSKVVELQVMKETRDKLFIEMRDILEVPEGQDMRAHTLGLRLAYETNLNLVQGAAAIIQKADKWFEEQPKKRKPRKPKQEL